MQQGYSIYVIMPHPLDDGALLSSVLPSLPEWRVILMDKKLNNVNGIDGYIYEDFEKNIYAVLCEMRDVLSKYQVLKMIFPEEIPLPKEIWIGFAKFYRVSYNKNPLFEFVLNGITTVSTNFRLMGATAADMIVLKSNIIC